MSRIREIFDTLQRRGEGALVAYVTAGDPDIRQSKKIVGALVDGGADIVELGIPFSDPIADGPTIQAAMVRALSVNTNPLQVVELCEGLRGETEVPLVLLTYYNPMYALGLENFIEKASRAGVDGFIIPDLPIEEAQEYLTVARSRGVDSIFLATPATPVDRAERIISETTGFLYLVSLYGVTGARKQLQSYTSELIQRFAPLTRDKVPLCVGFGISKPEHVKAVLSSNADGVIVGSAFVKEIERNRSNRTVMVRRIKSLASRLKGATRRPVGSRRK